jgi:hypothetical protein
MCTWLDQELIESPIIWIVGGNWWVFGEMKIDINAESEFPESSIAVTTIVHAHGPII